jgi:arylsulfatase A-like enzyme
VILDTLRKDHVGAYGNRWIHTPHLDTFAAEAVAFTRAYPESLPTLPMRRGVHTGMRTFPFHGHRDYKGDFIGAPGWGPIPEEQETVAELLGKHGYRSCLITDCYHQFKPSKNFHRGFSQWTWIRGQETDRYRSGPPVAREDLARHMTAAPEEDPALAGFLTNYLRNNTDRRRETDYYPARVFMEASRWIWDNRDEERFFLVVDSFDPHEPWDPPVYYRRLYDPDDDCTDVIQSLYAPWKGQLKTREVKRLQANYAGEVTMVDRWFGYFLETLRTSGRLEDTVVAVISDHGHNLGRDPGDKGLISKQGHPMTHAVADLVLMIRHPAGAAAGSECPALVYNHDLTATLLAMVGVEPEQKMDGLDFWPAVRNDHGKLPDSRGKIRDYVTVAWGPVVTVIDDEWWYNASIWGDDPLLYRVAEDPQLERNLAQENEKQCRAMLERAVADAGGSVPEAFRSYVSRPGCTPLIEPRRWKVGMRS